MLFLSPTENQYWRELAGEIIKNGEDYRSSSYKIRPVLKPVFHYYVGSQLAASGKVEAGKQWLSEGALLEQEGLMANAFLLGFLKRNHDRMKMPVAVFADPRPYVHFTGVPIIKESRRRLIEQCGYTLPDLSHPLKIMDVGCGDGGLMAQLLKHLLETGRIQGVGEVLLIDPSPAMAEMARNTVRKVVPEEKIKVVVSKIENVSERIDGSYDVALCSLSYHHLPLELKRQHLARLKKHFDHLLLFELDANHDTPQLNSPELALSAFQCYGRMIDFVFGHDAEVDVAVACVDCFLMNEVVSLLTQPRGQRNDYHMLRGQWHDLFRETLGADFICLSDTSCYADEYFGLFLLHYGRAE